MNSALMWIGGLLAALLAALFAVPYFVDWNGYRGFIEEEATRVLGREVRVGGKINVRLLPTPYLSFEKLRIADTRLGATEPLFRAETFTLWLSVPPLLQGNLEARHVAIGQPVVTLAVDKTGAGNWTTLGIRPGTLPFVPHNVALQAVDITDGTLVLQHPRAGEVGRLSGISGVVSAEALDGPFKYAGDIQMTDGVREVRIVTAKADADGTIRFKATASPKQAVGAAYKLDGSLVGVAGKPEISGALNVTLPLPELPAAPAQANAAGSGPLPHKGNGGPATNANPNASVFAELKGRLHADPDQLELKEVTASIENVGQPQLITGGLTLEWGRQRRLGFTFGSRWLDLDRLSGAIGRASPVGTVTALFKGLAGALPELASTQGTLAIDQLTLGGAPLAKLDLAMSREGAGELRIERLMAELPAGARVALDGAMRSSGDSSELDGTVTLAGPSLSRLAAWAMPDEARHAVPDGSFTLDSKVTLGPKRITLAGATGTLSNHALKGALTVAEGGALDLELTAETFESDWLWQGGLKRSAVMAWIERIAGGAQQPPAKEVVKGTPGKGGGAAPTRPVRLRLIASDLHGPDRSVRDLVADVSLADGKLQIGRMAFRAGDGLDVDLSGTLNIGGNAASKDGKLAGVIKGTVRAEDTTAAQTALAIFELAEGARTGQMAQMVPLRLAGEVSLGQRGTSTVDLNADGTAIGGRMTVRLSLDRGLDPDWRQASAELTLAGEDTAAVPLMTVLFARTIGDSRTAGQSMRANTAIKAVGIPADGMVTDAALSRDGLSLAYNGRVTVDADGVPSLAGTLEVAADRLGDVLALTGTPLLGSGENPVTGTVGLSFEDDGRTKLTPSGLTVAGAEVSGMLRVRRLEGGRLGVDGELDVNRASVPGLMSGLVQGVPLPVPVAATDIAAESAPSLWSDQSFAASAFDQLEGKVTVRLKHLGLSPGIGLDAARLGLTFAPGQVEVELADDGVLGGRLGGTLALARAAAGVRMKGQLELEGVELQRLAQATGSGRKAGGRAAASVAFAGQALNPRSLVTSLRGSGRLTFSDAFLQGMTPEGVAQVVAGVYAKEIDTDGEALQSEVLNRLGAGQLDIGSRDVGLEVVDGTLRVARFATAAPSGEAETLVTVDLVTVQAETEWRLKAKSAKDSKPDWPPVTIYYSGPVGGVATIEPRVALGGFERELVVRRMEYEVEELERLRKLDEERARQERERRKALAEAARLERERQKAIEEERLRQLQEEQRRSVQPAPAPVPAPRSDVPALAPPAAALAPAAPASQSVQKEQLPAIAPASPAMLPADAALLPSAATGEAGTAGAGHDGAPPAGTGGLPGDVATQPEYEAGGASAASNQPRPKPRAKPPPSASDTLMRSLNPGFN